MYLTRRQKRRLFMILVGLALGWLLYFAQSHDRLPAIGKMFDLPDPGLYNVQQYIDGDTIIVNMDGHPETIRFIGIDTPETHKPNTPVQCYGPAAAAHTKNIIAASGGRVRLVADALSTNRDRYNRLLRYVVLADGTNVNETNIKEGYAFFYPFFPFSRSTKFALDQAQAKAASRGLWGACHPTPVDGGGYKMEETQAVSEQH